MMLQQFGKILLFLGLVFVILGLLFLVAGKFTGLGQLPGDFVFRRRNVTIYFPLATSLLLSVLLSLMLWILSWWMKK